MTVLSQRKRVVIRPKGYEKQNMHHVQALVQRLLLNV